MGVLEEGKAMGTTDTRGSNAQSAQCKALILRTLEGRLYLVLKQVDCKHGMTLQQQNLCKDT